MCWIQQRVLIFKWPPYTHVTHAIRTWCRKTESTPLAMHLLGAHVCHQYTYAVSFANCAPPGTAIKSISIIVKWNEFRPVHNHYSSAGGRQVRPWVPTPQSPFARLRMQSHKLRKYARFILIIIAHSRVATRHVLVCPCPVICVTTICMFLECALMGLVRRLLRT